MEGSSLDKIGKGREWEWLVSREGNESEESIGNGIDGVIGDDECSSTNEGDGGDERSGNGERGIEVHRELGLLFED